MVWENIASGGLGFIGAHQQNKANSKQARKNRQFQERMSSTAYQRTMADMKEAGLNPMLAAKLGGASTPGGAQATMENTLSSAAEAAANLPATQNIKADTNQKKANTAAQQAQEKVYETQAELNRVSAKRVAQEIDIKGLEQTMKTTLDDSLKTAQNSGKAFGDWFYENKDNLLKGLKQVSPSLNPAHTSFKVLWNHAKKIWKEEKAKRY